MCYLLIHLEFYATGHILNIFSHLLNVFKISSELFREKNIKSLFFKDYAFLQLHNKHVMLLYTYC